MDIRRSSLLFLVLGLSLPAAAETLYFEEAGSDGVTRISLTIEGDRVSGTQVWQPAGEVHGSRGFLEGTKEGPVVRVVHTYTIEGSEQGEEEIFRLEGDRLLLGEGELVEGDGGLLRLKNPDKATFSRVLRRVAVAEPKPGTPERKAIMEAMRGPVSAYVGKTVEFTGEVLVHGDWARFAGNVAPRDGKKPANDEVAFSLELDFLALLKKDPEGSWNVMHWGFSGDIGVAEEAREKFPEAPWTLLP